MTLQLQEPNHVDEPREVREYADVITRVAAECQPVVLQRDGTDVAVVVPLEYFEFMQDALAREEAQRISGRLDWDRLVKANPPPQEWFDRDEPKPF